MEKNNKEEKEITFMLYNYPNINKLIEKRRRELLGEINVGSEAWKRSKTSLMGYTLEDIVERIDDDYLINRLRDWDIVLEQLVADISDNDLLYAFFDNKYFQRKSIRETMSKLHIDLDKYKNLDSKLKHHLYKICRRENIFVY